MDRNRNNHFANFPTIDITRTRMSINNRLKTTYDSSYLVPVYLCEVVPGDSIEMKLHQATRMATPIFPVMDTAMQDVFFFHAPYRILWDKYKEFYGENTTPEEWASPTEYEIPQIKSPEGGWGENTLADYFGLPINVNMEVSHLPFRMYAMIWNEYFRNVMTKTSVYINKDETTLEGKNTIEDPVTDAQLGGGLLKVARFHDMFTSAATQPSRGGDVMLPIGGTSGMLPVITRSDFTIPAGTADVEPLRLAYIDGSADPTSARTIGFGRAKKDAVTQILSESVTGDAKYVYPRNLWADASGTTSTGSTMFDFFRAYAVQNLLYRDGINGTRYRSLIKSHYRTTISDSTAQVPEYLGGARYTVNMDQVMQTSSTDAVSPQGNVSGFSLTSSSDPMFVKSFEEPGLVMGLVCIRNVESYQQGIEKLWSKKSRFDFYYPELSNIGDMAILNKEIYAQGTAQDDEVFGYQEAWYEYRMKPSQVTGRFRSNATQPLDSWHYANYFDSLPTLEGLNDATDENIERTIAVQSEPQFISDMYFDATFTRPMPAYSIPGLRQFM